MSNIHAQRTVVDWDKSLAGTFPFALKVVDQASMFAVALERNPNVVTVLRHWYDPGQVFGGDDRANEAKARAFFATFIDGTFDRDFAAITRYIEEWNEYLADSQNTVELTDRIRWARAVAKVWATEYRTQARYAHIQLILCNTAVGNWINQAFAEIAVQYDAVLGYHPYTLWQSKVRWDGDWLNLSGLWAVMEQEWGAAVKAKWGKLPHWIFTECGPFEAAETGWRHSACLGGDPILYIQSMREWIRNVKTTPAFREGRVDGFVVFNTGDPSGTWKYFETDKGQLPAMAEMIKEEWIVPDYEIPINPPMPPENMPLYCQRDPLWSSMVLDNGYTLGNVGCAITCCAMIAGAVDPEVNPGSLLIALKENDGLGPNDEGYLTMLRWWIVDDVTDLEYVDYADWKDSLADMAEVYAALEQGPIIVQIDYYPLTSELNSHFVVVYAKNGDNDFWMIDPWDGTVGSLRAKYALGTWDMARAIYAYRLYLPTVPVPEPEPVCVGLPREQYAREYWVVPSSVEEVDRVELYAMAGRAQVTVGPSYDDAGIGDLVSKKAVLWGVAVDEREVYEEWFARWYPGTVVEFR